jgi:thiamine pyrophosphate-dependent acetolactate synthase large subunit-like protein
LPLRIIVFDDGALSLIKVKQLQQKYRPDGVSIGEIDWPGLATSVGVLGSQADNEQTLRTCLENTVNQPGPVLIDAKISPETYQPTMRALRG